jgi:5-methylcytosine-specific restriction endonuclease McrA
MNSKRPWQKRQGTPPRLSGRRAQARADRIKLRDQWTCQACQKVTTQLEVDHRIPMSLGGSDEDDNLQSLCIPCHEAKSRRERHARERVETGLDGWPIGQF